jgi:LmbE family N-acetylglucosaminyl deacetylase
MARALRLLCVLAHPDDESLGAGGILARARADGVQTHLATATRGERGWRGPAAEHPGPEAVGRIREAETRAAAAVLGVREVSFLGYLDGELADADPLEAIGRVVEVVRRVRPHVVVTFPPDGHTGHPDHVAVSQFTAAALVAAADASYTDAPGEPHRVAKFYYMVDALAAVELVKGLLGDIGMTVDGRKRTHWGWPDWAVTTAYDAGEHWRTVLDAIEQHRSQSHTLERLRGLPDDVHRRLWGDGALYRVYSLVNGGRTVEASPFEGLAPAARGEREVAP